VPIFEFTHLKIQSQFEILCGDFRHDLLELKNTTYTK
jgi:hypothetical protein